MLVQMHPIKKIPNWFKGGLASLSLFLIISLVITPFLDSIRDGYFGYMIAEILNIPLLILSFPLIILYSYMGFFIDALFNTGVGYESLGVYKAGILFMHISSLLYYFLIGAFAVKIYEKRKRKV